MEGYTLDTERIRRGFDRAAPDYDRVGVLQRNVRDQLLERLDYVDIAPQLIVDAGSGTGQALAPLRERFPGARIIALDSSAEMLRRSRQCAPDAVHVEADARAAPLRDAGAGLVFSNLLLPWCDDLDAILAELYRVLGASGLLSFSTLGPDTLAELRRAWHAADGYEHVHGFIDMHDIGDALLRAGFADPVLDVERYTLSYPDLGTLLRELRQGGSLNALPGRAPGLVGRQRFGRVEAAYERIDEERLAATVEVVFGNAWRPENPRPRLNRRGEVVGIPATDIGRRL